MSKEVYVSFGVAKLLKEKGFDWECHHEYHLAAAYPWFHRKKKNFNGKEYSGLINEWYSAPTQAMACRWLMEEKHIFIGRDFEIDKETTNLLFYSSIKDMNTGKLITTIGAFSPEDAVEAALQYCLTNLI